MRRKTTPGTAPATRVATLPVKDCPLAGTADLGYHFPLPFIVISSPFITTQHVLLCIGIHCRDTIH